MNEFKSIYQKGAGSLTIFCLHGTGGTERDLLPLARELWPDANLLGVRGRVDENGAARFFGRHREGVFDVENLKSEANALADFLGWASGEYQFDADKIWALGYSNGANVAASLFFLRPAVLAGAVLLRAQTPLQDDLPDLSGKRILLLAGALDNVVPTEDIQNLEHHLKAAGAEVTLSLTDADHRLTGADIETAQNWLRGRA